MQTNSHSILPAPSFWWRLWLLTLCLGLLFPSRSGAALADAVDQPSIVFTSSGNLPWVDQSARTHDSVDAGASGPITHSQTSGFQAQVSGPAVISFWWRADSQAGGDFLRFRINGSIRATISGDTAWERLSFSLGTGLHTVSWIYSKNTSVSTGAAAGYVDQIEFEVVDAPPVINSPLSLTVDAGITLAYATTATKGPTSFAATGRPSGTTFSTTTGVIGGSATSPGVYNIGLSATNSFGTGNATLVLTANDPNPPVAAAVDDAVHPFTAGGNAAWTAQSAETHDGVDAARSGAITHFQTSSMLTTFTGAAFVSFWWKTDTEAVSDPLIFFIDGTEKARISGAQDWQMLTFAVVAPGAHTLRWAYSKNGSLSSGADAAWVDQVLIAPPSGPPAITSPLAVAVSAGIGVNYQTVATQLATAFAATGLPSGLSINASTGLITGTTSTLGAFPVQLTATNSVGSTTETLTITVESPFAGIPAAVEAPSLVFSGAGSAAWFSQTASSHDGVDAAQCGPLPSDGLSQLTTTYTGTGTVSFWWKMDSVDNDAGLRFFIDDVERGLIFGMQPWVQVSATISTAGPHTLKWFFRKGLAASSPLPTVWLDELSITPPSAPPVISSPLAAAGAVGSAFSYQAVANQSPVFSAAGLPLGLTLNPLTGLITGEPAFGGVFSVSLVAGNALGSDTKNLIITIANPFAALSDALDCPTAAFIPSGDALWFGQTLESHDGVDAARSGEIPGALGTAVLKSTIQGPAVLSWWWKADSQPTDRLQFGFDSVENTWKDKPGSQPWTYEEVAIPGGVHTVFWIFQKNSSTPGPHAGFLDEVRLTPFSGPPGYQAFSGPIKPKGQLAMAPDGKLYGTAEGGGVNGKGAIFRVEADNTLTTVYSFTGAPLGNPTFGLTTGSDGKLYGCTYRDFSSTAGGIFSYDPASGAFAVVTTFPASYWSHHALLRASDGKLYGTTFAGGSDNLGTVFSISPDGSMSTVVSFSGPSGSFPGSFPRGGLVQAPDGHIYGVTWNQSTGDRRLFRITLSGGYTSVKNLNGAPEELALGADGNLYYMTFHGGSIVGSIFKLTPSGGEEVLASLPPANGDVPSGDIFHMSSGPDGRLYMAAGDSNTFGSKGAIYRCSLNGVAEKVFGFTGTSSVPGNGRQPWSPLHFDANGHAWGIAAGGGPGGNGLVYRLDMAPEVVTGTADGLTGATAVLHGSVMPFGSATSAVFEWGTDPISLTSITPPVAAGAGLTSVPAQASLAGLAPNTTYFYRLRGDHATTLSRGATLSFTTSSAPTPDADNDGLPDAWEVTHFGSAGAASGTGDADNDGLNNFGEYAFGLNPNSGDLSALPQPTQTGGLLTLTVQKQPFVAYTVVASSDLSAGSFSTTGLTTVTDNATTLVVQETSPGIRRFMQVKAASAP